LLETGSITQRKLTERLGIQPGSASEVIAKLENAGLLVRAESPSDRRTTDIVLTEQGRVLAQEAAAQRKQRHKEMFSCLTQEERDTLLALLEKVNTDWRERYPGTGDSLCGRHSHGRERHQYENGGR
ncbi:MAG: MarR family transcriptional regulator, partial [Acetatifactor sp.]|nr:MarR family transcriptional regulator [Acetatifactor sp.]